MNTSLSNIFYGATEKIVAYLPNLVAGIILLAVGWFLGWLIKRIVMQALAVLRFDKLFRRFKWGAGLSKADVRYAFFEFIGNAAFLIVFLVLLNSALEALQLSALSAILQQGVLFIPKLLLAVIIFGLGWFISGWISGSVQRALTREEVPRASLIAKFVKAMIILFISAMALTELDVAKEIVIIGFSVTIITLGLLTVVVAAIGGKRFVSKVLETLDE